MVEPEGEGRNGSCGRMGVWSDKQVGRSKEETDKGLDRGSDSDTDTDTDSDTTDRRSGF